MLNNNSNGVQERMPISNLPHSTPTPCHDKYHIISSLDDPGAHEIDRSRILRKLGLTELDVEYSIKLFSEVNPSNDRWSTHFYNCDQISKTEVKIEQLLGYSLNRLRRAKALRLMGVTEDDVDLENSKNLGSLGKGGRKRSFIDVNQQQAFLFPYNNKEKIHNRRRLSVDAVRRRRKNSLSKIDRKRRKSSTDLRSLKCAVEQMHASLRKHATSTQLEVVKLRERVRSLEEEVKDYKVSSRIIDPPGKCVYEY